MKRTFGAWSNPSDCEAALSSHEAKPDGFIFFAHFGQKNGRGSGIRTRDFLLPKQARYQLRYAPFKSKTR